MHKLAARALGAAPADARTALHNALSTEDVVAEIVLVRTLSICVQR